MMNYYVSDAFQYRDAFLNGAMVSAGGSLLLISAFSIYNYFKNSTPIFEKNNFFGQMGNLFGAIFIMSSVGSTGSMFASICGASKLQTCLFGASCSVALTVLHNLRLWTQHYMGFGVGGFCGAISGGTYGLFKSNVFSSAAYGSMYGASIGSIGTIGLSAASWLTMYAGKRGSNLLEDKKKRLIVELQSEKNKLLPVPRHR